MEQTIGEIVELVQIILPERLQQRTMEQCVVEAPHVRKDIVEVVRTIPQEVEIVEVLVPQIQEPMVEAVIPHERRSEQIQEQIGEILFLQIEEKISPRARIQHCNKADC